MSQASVDTSMARRTCYWVLILLAAGVMLGRTASIGRVFEAWMWSESKPTPNVSLSDNDRSRWATIRALVDNGTFSIGERLIFDDQTPEVKYKDQGIFRQGGWGSIDVVLKPDRIAIESDGPEGAVAKKLFYSSKPPLLSVVLAGEYWLLQKLFGWRVDDDTRWVCMRTILFTFNGLPLAIAMLCFARLVERLGTTDFGKIVTVAAFCFCTYALAFATTINNHTVAIWAIVFAIYVLVRPHLDGQSPGAWRWLLAGLFTGWACANELPAGAFALAYTGVLLRANWKKTLLLFLPMAALPLLALLYTNYLALGTFQFAYAQFNSPWYRYPGSYWNAPGSLDKSNVEMLTYLFHLTFGHHGWFSLTPVMFLALFGIFGMGPRPLYHTKIFRTISLLTLAVSIVVFAFYLSRTDSYNYGGWTTGPRWLFWLGPLWLLSLTPIADWLGRNLWGRLLVGVTLVWSAASVAYPAWNPWRHPWLFEWLKFLKLVSE